MNIANWFRTRFGQQKIGIPVAERRPVPLREFVYLDEVSLRSLLSSQTGEVTDSKSEQLSDSLQANLDSTLGVNAPMLAKGEVNSRFQTANSSTLQTSRKATVQSWFREFHDLKDLRLIEPIADARPVNDIDELLGLDNRSVKAAASDLTRGSLVEFRVKLNADPVFHLGTMVTEFSSMVDDAPELFLGNNVISSIFEAQRVNNILQRLLAGLIPIRAEILDYSSVTISGVEYIVHNDTIGSLNLVQQRLEVVGVTEHLAYWKDIRRVLFSGAEFTMLCRVARDGLQASWTPVKLGDLFRKVAPDMVETINAASRSSFTGGNSGSTSINTNELLLNEALTIYKDRLLLASGKILSADEHSLIDDEIALLAPRAATVSGQRSAFQTVLDRLRVVADVQIDASVDAELRHEARTQSGLPLFPSISNNMTTMIGGTPPPPDAPEARLLDVEVIAIYW